MTGLTPIRKLRVALSAGLVAALLLAGGWWLAGDDHQPSGATRLDETPRHRARPNAAPEQRSRDAEPPPQPRPSSRERAASFDRGKRDALRTEILQALAERPQARPAAAPSADEQPPEPGQLTDQIGGREALLEHLNHDFMPLADECIEQARARRPELEGMLALGIETVADEELGGIVEAVSVQPQNEVDDAELLECLSQTALSMILPPPPESGREQFMITLPIEAPSE